MEDSPVTKGYTRGSQLVKFAGYSDWRLPTAVEWSTIQILDINFGSHETRCKIIAQLFPLSNLDERYWTATGRWSSYLTSSGTEKTLYKFLKIFGVPANSEKYTIAWEADFDRCIDASAATKHPVLLVRDSRSS